MDLYFKDIESRFKGYPYFKMDLDFRDILVSKWIQILGILLFPNGSRFFGYPNFKWI